MFHPNFGSSVLRGLRSLGVDRRECKCDKLATRIDTKGLRWAAGNLDSLAAEIRSVGESISIPGGPWDQGSERAARVVARMAIARAGRSIPTPVRLVRNANHAIGRGYHRFGWPFAFEAIRQLDSPFASTMFDDFAEQSFAYRRDPLIHSEPWIGIFHHSPNPPRETRREEWISVYTQHPSFQKSAENLKLAVALSRYLGQWLGENLDVPVLVLKHPTETQVSQWDRDQWETGSRRLLQVGWYMRNTRFIHAIDYPNRHRILDTKSHIATYDNQMARKTRSVGVVQDRHYVPDAEYDRLLSSSVIATELLDASANNVVVECIARSTPILVNRHPAAVEYLGDDYPLFWQTYEQAEWMAHAADLIQSAHEYLRAMPKDWLTLNHFQASLIAGIRPYASQSVA